MRLSSRVLKLLRQSAQQRVKEPLPVRQKRALRPTLGTLEPRLVLNATAELNSLGQLIISGDDAADVVRMETNATDQIVLRDGAGSIIPILGHPGSSSVPLHLSEITSGQLIVNLGGGDDNLLLQIPSGLSVNVIDGGGLDSTILSMVNPTEVSADRTIRIQSDRIQIDPQSAVVDFNNATVLLSGQVQLGATDSVTNVLLDGGEFKVVGSLTLQGDVNLQGNGTRVDLSESVLSSSALGHDFRITLGRDAGNVVQLGQADLSSGASIDDVIIEANSVHLSNNSFQIGGQLRITEAETITSRASIHADRVTLTSSSLLTVQNEITTANGLITLRSDQAIDIEGRLSTALSSDQSIQLVAPDLALRNLTLHTRGGDVSITGAMSLFGVIQVDTGAMQTATVAGNVAFTGPINGGTDSAALAIDTRGAGERGAITVSSAIGLSSPLDHLTLRGGLVEVNNINLGNGDLVIDALGTIVPGSSIATLGKVDITGSLALPSSGLNIAGNGVKISGVISGSPHSPLLRVQSTQDAILDGGVVQLTDLSVTAAGQATLRGPISLSGSLTVTSGTPTNVSSSSIATIGSQTFSGGVNFLESGFLSASQVAFGNITSVASGASFLVNASVVDSTPVVQGQENVALRKSGDGVLVLSQANRYTGATVVEAGVLRIDGSTASGSQAIQLVGGRLEGSGLIRGNVISQDGSRIDPGPTFAQLTVAGLELNQGSQFASQIGGTLAGTEYDQIVVQNAAGVSGVVLGGALLQVTFQSNAQPGAEYVIIRNDGDTAVSGLFSTILSPTGTVLTTPRLLTEGSLVAENFGDSGRPAYITYSGGDGNDVAIVTAGDVEIDARNVTLIERRGSNLEIRTGNDRLSANAAVPTIRPIAAINDFRIIVRGTESPEQLFVDLDRWIDDTPGAVQFTGRIFFDAGRIGDGDAITLLDDDENTDDQPLATRYQLTSAGTGSVDVMAATLNSQFKIQFAQTERFNQDVATTLTSFKFSELDEEITVSRDTVEVERSLIQSLSSTGLSTTVAFENPTEQLIIRGGDGHDQIAINSFGGDASPFAAAIELDGQVGDDRIEINTALDLGNDTTVGSFFASAENIRIAQSVSTAGGNTAGDVLLTGGTKVEIANDATINTGDAAIIVDANGGEFVSVEGRLVSTSQATAISVVNASTIRLGNVTASNGALNLETDVLIGTIEQGAGTRIEADRLIIDALGDTVLDNFGNDFKTIERIDSVANIVLRDSNEDLAINRLASTGQSVAIVTLGSLGIAANGIVATDAVVELTAGHSIVDLRVQNTSADPNIVARRLDLIAGANALGGAIGSSQKLLVVHVAEVLNADTTGSNGDIFVGSPARVLPIGRVNAGTGTVTLVADSINDASDDELSDIVARSIRLDAMNGIGALAKLELADSTRLSASTRTGGINLSHQSSQPLIVENLSAETGTIRFVHSGSEELTLRRVLSGQGDVSLVNQTGSVMIDAAQGSSAIEVSGAGNLQILAQGDLSDVVVKDSISTANGNVLIAADRSVVIASGNISSVRGDIVVNADERTGNRQGAITMSDGTRFVTDAGRIVLSSDGNVRVTELKTNNPSFDAIRVQSTSGAILRGAAVTDNLIATSGGALLESKTGVGNGDDLRTDLAVLRIDVSGTGPVQVLERDDIELRSIETNDGSIKVTAGGTIHAVKVVSLNTSRMDDPRGDDSANRDILLSASGSMNSDLRVGQIVAMNGADVELVANNDVIKVLSALAQINVIADDLEITSNNQGQGTVVAVDLDTEVGDLVINVMGGNRGDIIIREQDAIRLASSDSGSDDNAIRTPNGKITIRAVDSILISDLDPNNDGIDRKSDTEIFAGGDIGTVQLTALKTISLAGTTQIVAMSEARHSLVLEANQVAFSDTIELRAANNQGVARWFSPRPQPGLANTAFFDFTTVRTNRLAQAGANDATGVMTLTIGREGEKGLVIDIDWGAMSNQIERNLGLIGGQSYDFTHIYTEDDILNSLENGRTSATAPLQVRFAVSHHDSILVRGASVTQVVGLREEVPGSLVSSTDPDLPTLRDNKLQSDTPFVNGTASFIIPNLTIPVAFFPVRQIIPETVRPEVFVRVETSPFFASGSVESKSTSASTTISRDEYIQIRVLSLEPGAPDLAPPQPLPNDILAGDNLARLFAELPDGRYEIQYVLGDGNERTLLKVDVRNGEPIVPGDEWEGGRLELQDVDLEELRKEMQRAQEESDNLRSSNLEDSASHLNHDRESDAETVTEDARTANAGVEPESYSVRTGSALLAVAARYRHKHSIEAAPSRFSVVGRYLRRRSLPR